MDVYGEQSWWNFSCDLYISLFDGRPKRHRSDLQMSLWMEILSREKLHLLIYFVLFLTTLRMCYRSIKGILGSCESLCLLFIMLFNFVLVSFVVGSLWVVLRSSSIIWRSLWVVVGRCGILWLPQAYTSKSCAYHPDSECCTFFHGNLSNLKSPEQGRIQEFLKGGLYTTEVTLSTNGVEGEWRPLPLARSLEWVGSHTPPPKT